MCHCSTQAAQGSGSQTPSLLLLGIEVPWKGSCPWSPMLIGGGACLISQK